jgi:WD40 repeat protein
MPGWTRERLSSDVLNSRWGCAAMFSATFALVLFSTINCGAAEPSPNHHAHLVATLVGSGGEFAYFSPDGARLLTIGGDQARIWDVKSYKPLSAAFRHPPAINSAGWTVSGDRIFTAGGTNVCFWDGKTAQLLERISQKEPVDPTCVGPDENLIVTGNSPGPGVIWNARTGKRIRELEGPHALWSASFSADGKTLVTANWVDANDETQGRVVRLTDPYTGKTRLGPLTTDAHRSGQVAELSPDGSRLVMRTSRGYVMIDPHTGKELYRNEVQGLDAVPDSGFTLQVHFSPDGSAVVWAVDNFTRLDSTRTGKPLGPEVRHYGLIPFLEGDMAFNNDASVMYFGAMEDASGIWDMRQGERFQTFSPGYSRRVTLSPDRTLIAIAYQNMKSPADGHTEIWKVSE